MGTHGGRTSIVYKGRQLSLGRPAAIKVLPPSTADHNADARLLQGANVIAWLAHENVVYVYGVGRVGPTPDKHDAHVGTPLLEAAALATYSELEPSWLLSAHLPPVAEPEVKSIIRRAATFPSEGRVTHPGQQALDAALVAMGRAA